MDQRDQDLLQRQLQHLHLSPRHDGTVMLAIVAVFVIGLCVGGLLSAATEPAPFATNEHAVLAPSG